MSRLRLVSALLLPLAAACGGSGEEEAGRSASRASASIGGFRPLPLENAFATFDSLPVRSAAIAGEASVRLDTADVVQPSFSPDGRLLAFARVVVEDSVETDVVRLLDFGAAPPAGRTLLGSRASREYATYGSAVLETGWTGPGRLKVQVSDGDVGLTELELDAASGRVLGSSYYEAGDDAPDWMAAERRLLAAAFPELDTAALTRAAHSGDLVEVRGGWLFHAPGTGGGGPALHLLDPEAKTKRVVLRVPASSGFSLRGAALAGASTLFMLATSEFGYVFELRDGRVRPVARVPIPFRHTELEVKHASGGRAVFLVHTRSPSQSGDNPLYVLSGDTLTRATDCPAVSDAAVTPDGARIALVCWEGDHRRMRVAELLR